MSGERHRPGEGQKDNKLRQERLILILLFLPSNLSEDLAGMQKVSQYHHCLFQERTWFKKVRVLTAKHDKLSWIPRTHTVEGENQLPQVGAGSELIFSGRAVSTSSCSIISSVSLCDSGWPWGPPAPFQRTWITGMSYYTPKILSKAIASARQLFIKSKRLNCEMWVSLFGKTPKQSN